MLRQRLAPPPAQPWVQSHGIARRSGRWLQDQRRALFRSEPWCRACAEHGVMSLACIRDHIRPLAEGGTDAPGNVQPLCQVCSDAKTAEEGKRGRGLR
jgi:5-methylcytosine-specific restriction enzyme A